MAEKIVKTDAEWQKLLTPQQYAVARQHATERPFTGEYVYNKAEGTYWSPGELIANERHCRPSPLAGRIEPQVPQEQHGIQGGRPLRAGGPIAPPAVGTLPVEDLGAPTFHGNPGPLGGNDLGGLPREITHDLPTDRGVGVKQPPDHGS